ncbi:MAG TPA: YciI family protein [Xanthobacteraceae bacterium]|nr:YciI family protein [Xanthobacteraceae bacterium]
MAQVIIRRSTIDLLGLPRSLRHDHARFLREWRDALVTYGPIFRGDAPSGYLYQLDLPGTVPEATARFVTEDPLTVHGVVESDEISDWHCALATRQPTAPVRPGLKGFFFHGIGKPGITEFRNTILAAHRAHLQQRDASNCLSRGYLTDADGKEWLGSAMVYEFESRAALDDFFRDEPYCTNGIYQRIDIYDWQRGAMA